LNCSKSHNFQVGKTLVKLLVWYLIIFSNYFLHVKCLVYTKLSKSKFEFFNDTQDLLYKSIKNSSILSLKMGFKFDYRIEPHQVYCMFVFRCVHASLYEGLSVRPLVRPSVPRFFRIAEIDKKQHRIIGKVETLFLDTAIT